MASEFTDRDWREWADAVREMQQKEREEKPHPACNCFDCRWARVGQALGR